MRLNFFIFVFAIIAGSVLSVAQTDLAINTADIPLESVDASAKKNGSVRFLLGRAIDASGATTENQWMIGLIEAVIEFKSLAYPGFVLVSPDSVKMSMPSHGDYSKVIDDAEYLSIGKKLNADYVGIQKFEVSKSDKSVFYYMEIISVENKEVVSSIEKTFKLNGLGAGLDDVFGAMLKEFKVENPITLSRFIKLPAVGEDQKVLKQLGECINLERFSRGADSAKIAADYTKICEKDRTMFVANYRGGFFLEAVGKNSDASEALNLLFISIPEYIPVFKPLCRNLRKAKRFDDALKICMLAEQRGVKDVELVAEKALILESLGRKVEAENAYKQILEIDPEDPNGLLFYARSNNAAGNAVASMEYSKKLIQKRQLLGWANLELGRSMMLLAKNAEAILAFTEASKYLQGESEPSIYLGDLYVSSGQFSKAVTQYEMILKKAPDNVDLYQKAASAAEKTGDLKKALAILKQIEPRFSNHGGLQRDLGLLTLANGDTAKARVYLESSMRSGTEDERVLVGLGWIYVRSGDFEKAIVMLSRALETVKDKSKCKLGLAIAYARKGDAFKASKLLDEVTTADLNVPGISKMLGEAFLIKGDKTKALSYFIKERLVTKTDTSLQANIAAITYDMGNAVNARNEYIQLTKMRAGGAAAFYKLVVLSLKLKDMSNAALYLVQAEKLGSADAQTWLSIGKEYASLGNFNLAIQSYENGIKKDPLNDTAIAALAFSLEKVGKDSAAAEAHSKLYSMNASQYKNNLILAGKLFEKVRLNANAKKVYYQFLNKPFVDNDVTIRLAHLEAADKNYPAVLKLLQNVSPTLINLKEASILAEAYCKTDQHTKALPHLTFMLSLNPKDLKAIELSATINEKNNNFADAIALYKKYLLIGGKHPDYAFRIGDLYEKQKNIPLAISTYESNLKVYPGEYKNFDRLARIYCASNSWVKAVPVLNKAVLFKEASVELSNLLAEAQVVTGNKAGAVLNYKTALEKNDRDSAAWFKLGSIYYEMQKFTDAVNAFQKASVLMVKNADLYKMWGISLFKTGNLAAAVTPLEKARELNKKDEQLIDYLTQSYRQTKNQANLILLLTERAQLDLKNFSIRKELADLLMAESRFGEAAKVLEDAVGLKDCSVEMHLKLAEIYQKTKDDDKLFSHLRTALQCTPQNAEINFQIARYFLSKNDPDKAEDYLRKTILYSPKHVEAPYQLGIHLLATKRQVEATPLLIKAVAADPKNREYRVALADAQYKSGKFVDALKTIKPAVSLSEMSPQAMSVAGLIYKAAGQTDTARLLLEGAVQSVKSCGECYLALGNLYFEGGNYKDAARFFQSGVEIGGYDQNSYLRLAQSYNKLGKDADAKKIFEIILTKDNPSGEAFYRVINHLVKDNNGSVAKDILIKSTGKKDGWYYLGEASVYENEKKVDAAFSSYLKALKALPDAFEANAGCGRMCVAKKKYSEAIMYFGQAMAGDPESAELMFNMGVAFEGANELSNALEMYLEVAKRQNAYPDLHYNMARIYSKTKDHSKAVQSLKEAVKLDKKNGVLYLVLGHEYRKLKMDDAAVESYLKAASLDEKKFKDSYKYVGTIYYVKKDEKRAKKYYEMYITAGGQDSKVQALINKIP